MRILVFIPMSPKTKPNDPLQVRIFGRSLQSILRLEWSGPISYHFEREDHHSTERYTHITQRYELARNLTLRGDYDALLCVESDMIVPPLALQRMTKVDADIVYGLSCNKRRKNWLCAIRLWERGAHWLSQDPDQARAVWGQVVESQGAGLGCTLIHRRVLDEISFRREKGGPSNDWYFALDAKEAGFSQAHDLGTIVGHINVQPAPLIVWPDIETDKLYRIEYLPGVVIEELKPGDEIPIGRNETIELFVEGKPVEVKTIMRVEEEPDGL